MKQMTERSAKWMKTVLANCEANTGHTLPQWVALAKKAGVKSEKEARAWGKENGLSIVYQGAVAQALFDSDESDGELLEAQYKGAKAALRPVYDSLVKVVRAFGDDVQVWPRKSQVTLSRATSFAVLRAATKSRLDVALKLHGEKGTARLVPDAKAMRSDPSHVVGIESVKEIDRELLGWLRKAYQRAAPGTQK